MLFWCDGCLKQSVEERAKQKYQNTEGQHQLRRGF